MLRNFNINVWVKIVCLFGYYFLNYLQQKQKSISLTIWAFRIPVFS